METFHKPVKKSKKKNKKTIKIKKKNVSVIDYI